MKGAYSWVLRGDTARSVPELPSEDPGHPHGTCTCRVGRSPVASGILFVPSQVAPPEITIQRFVTHLPVWQGYREPQESHPPSAA